MDRVMEEIPRQLLIDAFKALSFPDDVQFRDSVMARLSVALWPKLTYEDGLWSAPYEQEVIK